MTIVLSELKEFERVEMLEEVMTDLPSFSYWFNKIDRSYRESIRKSAKFQYRPYQSKYAAMSCLRQFNLLAYSMGAGKTTISILIIQAIYNLVDRPKQIHIAVPSILAAQRWLEDLAIVFPSSRFEYVSTEAELHKSAAQIIIYNHDLPKRLSKDKSTTKPKHLSGYLSKLYKPSLLVVDEIHALSNSRSDRARHLLKIRLKSKRVLGLTGTLIDSKLDNIDRICRFVYNSLWSFSGNSFVNHFSEKKKVQSNYLTGDEGEGNRYLDFLSTYKLEEYYATVRRFVHRLTLNEPQVSDFIKIPEQVDVVTIVEPSVEQKKIYNEYLDGHRRQLDILSTTVAKEYQPRALEIIYPLVKTVNVSVETEDTSKVKEILRIVKDKSKVAIFCNYVESGNYLTKRLQAVYGDKVLRLSAECSQVARIEIVKQFQYGISKIGVFSSNLAAEAIDLTAADCVIFYCLPWSSLKIQQSIARVIRPGNIYDRVEIHYLATKGCIDVHQLNLAQDKLKLARRALDYDDIGEDTFNHSSTINPNQVLLNLLLGE